MRYEHIEGHLNLPGHPSIIIIIFYWDQLRNDTISSRWITCLVVAVIRTLLKQQQHFLIQTCLLILNVKHKLNFSSSKRNVWLIVSTVCLLCGERGRRWVTEGPHRLLFGGQRSRKINQLGLSPSDLNLSQVLRESFISEVSIQRFSQPFPIKPEFKM